MRLLPESAELHFIGAYARAVLAVSNDSDPDRAEEPIDTAPAGGPDQIQAGAIRLRRLATGHPSRGAVFMELADRLARAAERIFAVGDPVSEPSRRACGTRTAPVGCGPAPAPPG